MRTRRSNYLKNSNVTIPRRRRKQVSNIVEPEIRTIVEMAECTMEELLRAPTKGYREAIVLPEINADHFEIKTNLHQLVQANPFNGRENENPHAHINNDEISNLVDLHMGMFGGGWKWQDLQGLLWLDHHKISCESYLEVNPKAIWKMLLKYSACTSQGLSVNKNLGLAIVESISGAVCSHLMA
ncbi:hypothetical protein Tco_0733030 [Tanacetum coccineum]